MKKVQEIVLPAYQLSYSIEFPKNAELLSIRFKNDHPIVAYLYDLSYQDINETRELIFVKNGDSVDGTISRFHFITTLEDSTGSVFHVFKKIRY